MLNAKTYVHTLVVITLLFCFHGLWAMKIPSELIKNAQSRLSITQKPKVFSEIKDHGLEIIKHADNVENIIIPESLKVVYAPFLIKKPIGPLMLLPPLPLSTKKIAFFDGCSTKIWNMVDGKEYASPNLENFVLYPLIKLTNDSILMGNTKGGITIWNFENNTYKTIKNAHDNDPLITAAITLTKKTVATINFDGAIEVWDLENNYCLKSTHDKFIHKFSRLSKTKIISFKPNCDISCCDLENKSYKNKTYKICNDPSIAFTCLSCISDKKFVLGGFRSNSLDHHGFIKTFDSNSSNAYKETQETPLNLRPFSLLYLPFHNALVSFNRSQHWLQKQTLTFSNLQNPAIEVQSIDLSAFLKKYNDYVSSMIYLEEENTIMILGLWGNIITVRCKDKVSEDLSYFFNNMKISQDKKNFKDLNFNFYLNN